MPVCALLLLLILTTPAVAHDPYSDWKLPSGASCCSNQDCRPVRAYRDPDDGWWRAQVNGQWRPVPPSVILDRVAPDGGSHICINPMGIILCFVGGVPKS